MLETPTIVYIVLDVIIALVVIGGNTLVCCVILNSTSLRKKAMYIFVTSLAFADICVGITAIPFGILTKLGIPYNSPSLCITMLSFIVISTQISIFNMMAIAVERYLAIRHPRIHYTKLTPKRSLYIIALTWISAVLIGCLPLLGWNKLEDFSFPIDHSTEGGMMDYNLPHKEHVIEKVTKTNLTQFYLYNITPPNADLQHHVHCKFMKMMDEDYMFFNFTVCVLPPLITCAALYFVIFLSLIRTKQPSDKLYDQQKHEKIFNSRTPIMLHRKHANSDHSPLPNHHTKNLKSNSKVNIVINLPPEDALERQLMWRHSNSKELSKNIKKLNLSPRFRNPSEETSRFPLLTPGVSKETESTSQTHSGLTKGLDPDQLFNHLSTFSVDDLRKPNYCQAFKMKFGHSLIPDGIASAKSSCTSTPILTRSCSGHLNWDEYRRKKHHHIRCKKEVHAATVLGLIVLSFIICWMPIHILNTIIRFNKYYTDHPLPPWVFDVGVLLSHTNSAVNFFLYSWRLKAFRKQLHRMTFQKISRSWKAS